MSEEEGTEFELPLTNMEAIFISLHQEYLFAQQAGFTSKQAFRLVRDVFQARLASDISENIEED